MDSKDWTFHKLPPPGCSTRPFGDDILRSETERLIQFRANLGGPVSGELLTDDWPEGKGNPDYDFYSPLLFNEDRNV